MRYVIAKGRASRSKRCAVAVAVLALMRCGMSHVDAQQPASDSAGVVRKLDALPSTNDKNIMCAGTSAHGDRPVVPSSRLAGERNGAPIANQRTITVPLSPIAALTAGPILAHPEIVVQAIVQIFPVDPIRVVWRGCTRLNDGDIDGAIADFDEAIRLDPQYFDAYLNRGGAWSRKKEFDRAIDDLSEAIRCRPTAARAFESRALVWWNKHEYDKAITDFDEAIRLAPSNIEPLIDRGSVWLGKKQYDKAIADTDEAIRRNPKAARAYRTRGSAWFAKKDYDKAIGDLNEAIQLDPRFADAYHKRARRMDRKERVRQGHRRSE